MVSLSPQPLDVGVVTKFVTDSSAGGVSVFIGEPSTNCPEGDIVLSIELEHTRII